MLLRMLGNETVNEIENYITEISSRNFMIINSVSQIKSIFNDSIESFLDNLTEDELMYLRSYTGYNYRNINAILRGKWFYERNGILTEENKLRFKNDAMIISAILNKFNMPNIDFITFRGVTLNYFSNYGIYELEQLETLKGKFLYEQAFTSTSILEETSYFNKK